jgi:putative tricarboxylic transport membrane protein
MTVDSKDLGAGAVFIAVAATYGGTAWYALPAGSASSMGPGYFPLVLSALIAVVGLVLVFRGLIRGQAAPFAFDISWRAVALVSISIGLFGFFLRELGMFASVAGVSFLTSMASRKFQIPVAATLAIGLATLCSVVFGYGVRLPIPIFGSWIAG